MSKLVKKLIGAYATDPEGILGATDLVLTEDILYQDLNKDIQRSFLLDKDADNGLPVDRVFDYSDNSRHADVLPLSAGTAEYVANDTVNSSGVTFPVNIDGQSTATIAGHFYVDSTDTGGAVLFNVDFSGDDFGVYRDGTTGQMQTRVRFATAGYVTRILAQVLPVDTWFHVAITFDGQIVRSYYNGSLIDTHDLGAADTIGSRSVMSVGMRAVSTTVHGLIGRYSHFRAYDAELSLGEIGALNAKSGERATNLLLFASFNEAAYTGGVVTDSSGNANNGTVVGSVAPLNIGGGGSGTPYKQRVVTLEKSIGVSFDGATEFMDLKNTGTALTLPAGDVGFLNNQDFSVAFAYSGTEAGSNTDYGMAILGRDNADVIAQLSLHLGKVRWAFYDGVSWGALDTSGTINDGNLHTVVLTYEGSTGDVIIYLDGIIDTVVNGVDGGFQASRYFKPDLIMKGYNGSFTEGNLYDMRIYSALKDSTFAKKYDKYVETGGLSVSVPADAAPPAPATRVRRQSFSGTMDISGGVTINGAWRYVPLTSGYTDLELTSAGVSNIIWPVNGRIFNFRVEADVAPGLAASEKYIEINLGCTEGETILEDQFIGVDLYETETSKDSLSFIDVRPGENLYLRYRGHRYMNLPAPTPFTKLKWSFDFLPVVADEFVVHGQLTDSPSVGEVAPLCIGKTQNTVGWVASGSINNVRQRWPVTGTISDVWMYNRTAIDDPADVKTYRIHNETKATSLDIVLTQATTIDGDKVGSNTAGSLAVDAGDIVYMEFVSNVGSSVNDRVRWAFKFVPTTAGEGFQMSSLFADNVNTTLTEYNNLFLGTNVSTWTTTETDRRQKIGLPIRLSDLAVRLNNAPGVGNSYTFTIMVNGVASTQAVTISDANTSGVSISSSLDLVRGDEVSLRCVPSGTPTAALVTSVSVKETEPSIVPHEDIVRTVICGRLFDDGFTVSFETLEQRNDTQMVVSLNSNLSSPVAITPVKATALNEYRVYEFGNPSIFRNTYLVQHSVTGLTPFTEYYYGLRSNGTDDVGLIGRVKTAPAELTEPTVSNSYTIVFWTCDNTVENGWDEDYFNEAYRSWYWAADTPLMSICMGDLVYADARYSLTVADPHPKYYLGEYLMKRRTKHFALMSTRMAQFWQPDDHESTNNPNLQLANFSVVYPITREAMKLTMPLYDDVQPPGTGYVIGHASKFTIGNVRYIVLDALTQREEPGVGAQTMLGDGGVYTQIDVGSFTSWDQKSWVAAELLQAKTDGCKAVRVISNARFEGSGGQGWLTDYPEEQAWLCQYIADNDIPTTEIWSGDAHRCALDDGGLNFNIHLTNPTDGQAAVFASSCLGSITDNGIAGANWNGASSYSTKLVDQDLSALYQWTQSASNPVEYYLEAVGGGAHKLQLPSNVSQSLVTMDKKRTAGSLTARSWAWDDNDSLGFNTVYVRTTDDSAPRTTYNIAVGYWENWVEVVDLDENNTRLKPTYYHQNNFGDTIEDPRAWDDGSYTIQFDSATYNVDDDQGSVVVRINATGWIGPKSVETFTTNGTATSGVNYTGHTATVRNFFANKGFFELSIPIINAGSGGTFTVTLQNPVGGSLGAQTTTTVTINNV